MALNITFQGNIESFTNGSFSSNEVKYQAYFHKTNLSSSSSKWNTVRQSELGQFSFNLGDGDFLTQDGAVNNGDTVLILFWTPNTEDKNSLVLTEWGLIEVTLTGSSTYIQNIQIRPAFSPNATFNLTGSSRVGQNVNISDSGCNDDHSWTYSSKTHYQLAEKYSVELFNINYLSPGCIDVYWDMDSTTDYDLNLNPSCSISNQYATARDYTIRCYVENKSGLSSHQQFTRRIYWNIPTVDFVISDSTLNPQGSNGLGEVCSCTNNTNDPDLRMSSDNWTFDWVFSDSGSYGDHSLSDNDKSFIYSPEHTFYNPGSHTITLTCNWFDGFNWQTQEASKNVVQNVWITSAGLTWSTPVTINSTVLFTPNITGTTGETRSVNYLIDGELTYSNLSDSDFFIHEFQSSNDHTIEQIVFYHDGFSDQTCWAEYNLVMVPVCSFVWENYEMGLKFTDTSIAGKPPITNRIWRVRNSKSEIINISQNTEVFYYAWPYADTFTVELEITDSTPNSDSSFEVFEDIEIVASTNSGPPPIQTQAKIVRPKIRVQGLEESINKKDRVRFIVKSAQEQIIENSNFINEDY